VNGPATPFESGNGNQTTPWEACIAFHRALADAFPGRLAFGEIGRSDGGSPLHGGVFDPAGVFDAAALKAAGRPVVFVNNGIHPGEPEGIDACMALVRDLCHRPDPRAVLGDAVLVYLPVYNVDGMRNRGDTSRVNQLGPEAYGFRGNARHLDLNRDFVKATSLEAQAFARWFARWDPDAMVDTHTSNGADYQHTMTLIATQPDKLGGRTGALLREAMLPALYAAMEQRGFPMCPYVNTLGETPEEGIADFPDTPRFSTGWAALHHTIGFMPETHMLKPFAERVASTRAFMDTVLEFVRGQGMAIRSARAADRAEFSAAATSGAAAPLRWELDRARPSRFLFRGFRAVREPSRIGRWTRLRYDRHAPWTGPIPYFDRLRVAQSVPLPRAYLLPQAWREVAERLLLAGVRLVPLPADVELSAQAWRVVRVAKAAQPFEGAHLHEDTAFTLEEGRQGARAGDWLIPLGTARDRYVVETLEPAAADSYFRWGFFDSVLDRKEGFSDYVFEDEAERLLADEPGLRAAFDAWCAEDPRRLDDAGQALGFLHRHSRRWAEPQWRRVPVLRIVDSAQLQGLLPAAA
jgi:hypothetical protein